MRTRSGSLAAVMARVPSHPAHSGVLCICAQTRAVVPAPDGGYPGNNTAEGSAALFSLFSGVGNTAVGRQALFFDVTGSYNTAVGFASLGRNLGVSALFNNLDGFSNNAFGDSALFENQHRAANTAIGDVALANNDLSGSGDANNNTAVGAQALEFNVDGSENTAGGTGAGLNLINGFNDTYIGNFVGSVGGIPDEESTIRIGDISTNGFGSAACFIGGIFNNSQPVGSNVVVVTLNLDTDQLGFDPGMARGGSAPAAPHRNASQPRVRPQPQHQAMLNDKVEKLQATVTQQQATVAQQQKQIETLTAQLKEQAAQIQKVSAQVEMIKPAPRVVDNR